MKKSIIALLIAATTLTAGTVGAAGYSVHQQISQEVSTELDAHKSSKMMQLSQLESNVMRQITIRLEAHKEAEIARGKAAMDAHTEQLLAKHMKRLEADADGELEELRTKISQETDRKVEQLNQELDAFASGLKLN